MIFRIDGGSKEEGPFMETHVLNTDECNVAGVGVNPISGNLFYRERFHAFGTSKGIDKVLFLTSKVHRRRKASSACEADFDIYLEDGRVIEVNSCCRSIIEAALKHAPTQDVRAKYRQARGR